MDKSSMLSARRKSDGTIVTAYFASKASGPFSCAVCGDPVVLKTCRGRVSHFAHLNPLACRYAENESDEHRHCKMEIHEALLRQPGVKNVALERPFDNGRADVFAEIRGVPVAIEVQISALSPETIQSRTIEYARDGVYVLWLLPWTPKLDGRRYAPRPWEKWLHALYFGQVYYWTGGLTVVSYRFEPTHRTVPRKTWYSANGKKMIGGGYSRRSGRYRTPARGRAFNLATDFAPRNRGWWESNNMVVPAAKLFMERGKSWENRENGRVRNICESITGKTDRLTDAALGDGRQAPRFAPFRPPPTAGKGGQKGTSDSIPPRAPRSRLSV